MTTLMIVGLTALASARDEAPAPTLVPGNEVPLEPVTGADWIQGAAPANWEDGKVYIFECWATWCGPCVAAIPHVNELHKKYAGQGLRICGMNVWEDGRDKVAKFVKDKGDGMSYPVAYTGKGSAFATQWLKAAGVRGIPHAFVVKGGKFLFGIHPMQLDEEIIEALLAGGEAETKAIEKIRRKAADREALSQLSRKFRKAASGKDAEAMAATIAEVEQLDPEARSLPQMRLDLAIAKEDWTTATAAIAKLAASQGSGALSGLVFRTVSASDPQPRELREPLAKYFGKALEKGSAGPTGYVLLANLRQSLDDKEGAIAAARAAVDKHGKLPAEPFDRYAKALENGENPPVREVFGWLQEAMSKKG